MSSFTGCSVVIKDDFGNLLVLRRKVKKTEPKLWGICGKKLKGKETFEKCANRAVKDDFSVVVFDLKEIETNADNEGNKLFVGTIKEKVLAHKDISECKWIRADEVDTLDFHPEEKELLLNYINSSVK